MAKAKYIRGFELDVIRVGISRGFKAPTIARYLGRGKQVIYNHIADMERAGTLQDLPFDFEADTIAGEINGE